MEMETVDKIIAGLCFLAGLSVLAAGCWVGVKTKITGTTQAAKDHLADAKQKLEGAEANLRAGVRSLANGGSPGGEGEAAVSQQNQAKSAIQQASDIIGSLPEALRFAGLLVLVGTILIGVATIQFGGTAIF